ncbi:hypothetical protein L7F22_065676 [Adiantum nelumboides]|nr:hypothetical protein [Adiantum nelumboides]
MAVAEITPPCMLPDEQLPPWPSPVGCSSLYCKERDVEIIEPGSFEPINHFYPRVLNAEIHPLVSSFLSLDNDRIAKRCTAVADVLHQSTWYFQWGGSDLFATTTDMGQKKLVVVETNSCPFGQKSMPLANEDAEHAGYRTLLEKSFMPSLRVHSASLPPGCLSIFYDKNRMEAWGYAATLADLSSESILLVPCYADDFNPKMRFTDDGVLESMSDLSRSSSRDSRRSRGSTESRISRYSDEELLEEIQRRGLHSTGESARADSDRQSSVSQSRHHTPRHTPQRSPPKQTSGCGPCCFGDGTSSRPTNSSRPPKYPTTRRSPLVGASQATTPLETPRLSSYTPLETPRALETPDFTPGAGTSTRHGWSPEETSPETPTFSKTYYDIDDDVWIVADNRGNLVISDLKGLIDVYMLRHMFTNWKKVPYEDKQVIHGILHEREDVLFSHMGKILRSKRSEIEKAIKGNYKKPSWCSKQLWDLAKERHKSNVGKWSQQREARKVQLETQGTHKLGSGGKARFKALFKEAVDRYPTQQEVMRGRAIGLSALLEELAASGTQVKNMDVRQVLRPKFAKLLSIIYDLMQADYTYNESIDAVSNMGPPLLSQTAEYPDFVERTPDDEDEDDEDYLPTDEEECEETSESEE